MPSDDKMPGAGTNDAYWRRMYEQYERASTTPCINDLFKVAERDPMVRAAVMSWRSGAMTFEQMMIWLVMELSERCRRYSDNELRRLQFDVPSPVVIPKSTTEED